MSTGRDDIEAVTERLDEAVPVDRHGLEILSRAECDHRLGAHHIGRVAVLAGDQPLVLPVNYGVDRGDVVFRSAVGTKLHAAIGHRVAFEIDGLDPLTHGGWSVLVVGAAEIESRPGDRERLEALPLGTWAPGRKPIWVRVRATSVTGRRIVRA